MELMPATERCRRWMDEAKASIRVGSSAIVQADELRVQLSLMDKLCLLIEKATMVAVDGNQYLKTGDTWTTNHKGERIEGICLLSLVLYMSREKQEAGIALPAGNIT